MPTFDLPLNELKSYTGSSLLPDDFDLYWEKALAEMESTVPDVKLIPSEFQVKNAECFDLFFTGVRGASIHAKYVRPIKVGKYPLLLMFHGYSENAGLWCDKLCYINAGFCVAALDCRGQGGQSQDSGGDLGNTQNGHLIRGLINSDPQDMLYRHIYLDTVMLAKIAMSFDEVDSKRVCACGGSQGGALALACASLLPGIKKVSVCVPYLCDFKRAWELDLSPGFGYGEIAHYFKYFDPLHESETKIFQKLGYLDIQNHVPRVNAEVLWAVGLRDVICPPSTQFAAYNKIRSKKNILVYPDIGHALPPRFKDIEYQFLTSL